MNLSVCVDAVFMEQDFCKSLEKVKQAGYTGFEFWSWWDKDIDSIIETKENLGLDVITFCTKMVSLVDDSKHEEFLKGLEESIQVAKRMKCSMLIAQVGDSTDLPDYAQHYNLVNGLKKCVPILEKNNITLVFEPLNLVDHKGYYLTTSEQAFLVAKQVNSKNVKFLFDIYHQQITEGNIISNINKYIDCIGHFHAAGNPGRNELYTGELNYINIFNQIKSLEFNGHIGLEYFSKDDVLSGLIKTIDMI